MRHLTESAWEAFVIRDGNSKRFNGDKFEQLIRALLRARFPGDWAGTPKTRDGGKDVVDRSIPGSVAWAECKMYRMAISLQVVSNTLVMAIIGSDVKRIMFFSYSEMINNAKDHLARFATNTGKTIQVFDAEMLEALILGTPSLLEEYFSHARLPVGATAGLDPIRIRSHFSSDVHVNHLQLLHVEGALRPRQHAIPIHTPCLYEIILEACGEGEGLAYELQQDASAFEGFQVLNAEQFARMGKRSLEFGQTLSIPIYLAPTRSGHLTLPALKISRSAAADLELPPLSIQVSALVHPILIGEAAIKGLKTLAELVSTANTVRTCVVYGKSGVGKSRFADEAIKKLLSNEFTIHFFSGSDKRNQTPTGFFKTLLCSLWRLPLPLSPGDSNRSAPPSIPVSEFGEVSEIVYGWDAARFAIGWERVYSCVSQGFAQQRAGLVIDNVQDLPIDVLSHLIPVHSALQGTPGQAMFLLTFTEDALVFNESAAAWFHELRKADSRQTLCVHLPEFGRPLAELFFDNLFARSVDGRAFSDAYPVLLETILAKVMPRPLDLFQFVKGLEDDGAIRAHDEVFTILDFTKLDRALHSLQGDRASLLSWRMGMLDRKNGAMLTAAAITYFGALSLDEMRELELSEDTAANLVQASVMRWDEIGQLAFYHSSLARHFIEATREGSLITPAHKAVLFERAQVRRQREGHGPEWFGLAFDVGADVTPALSATVDEYRNQDFSGYAQSYLVADRLLAYCYRLTHSASWEAVLPALAGAAHVASQSGAGVLKARTQYLAKAARKLVAVCPSDTESLRHWTHIIREAAGYSASTNEDSITADRLLQKALGTLAHGNTGVDANHLQAAQAHLLNRRCVTLKNLGQIDKAVAVGEQSARIAGTHGWDDLVCLNRVDMGYVFYGLRARNADLLGYWRAACVNLEEQPVLTYTQVPNIHVVKALIAGKVAILDQKFEYGTRTLDALLLDCRERRDAYYLLQGLAVKGCLLVRQALCEPQFANRLAERALEVAMALEDSAAATDQARRYRCALYLQGKAHEVMGAHAKAQREYERAALIPMLRQPDPEGEAIRYDAARLQGKELRHEVPATTFAVGDVQLPLP